MLRCVDEIKFGINERIGNVLKENGDFINVIGHDAIIVRCSYDGFFFVFNGIPSIHICWKFVTDWVNNELGYQRFCYSYCLPIDSPTKTVSAALADLERYSGIDIFTKGMFN